MSKAEFLRVYKLQVLGDGAVGKSALTIQFVQSIWLDDYTPTIEDSYRKQCVVDDEVALIDILDTAGQEEYRAMRDQYILDGEGFMLVYSITHRESFQEMASVYDNILRVKDRAHVPAILIGNKCDLEFERQVAMNEGRDRARVLGCGFLETSAKYRVNVEQAFCNLVRAVRRYNKDFGRPQFKNASQNATDQGEPLTHTPIGCCSRCVVA